MYQFSRVYAPAVRLKVDTIEQIMTVPISSKNQAKYMHAVLDFLYRIT